MTGRLFVCCPGFPLPALDSVLGVLLNVVGQRWELSASYALLALLSICSGRRFLTSQPYSPSGQGHSFVVSSVALLTVAYGVRFGW